MALHHDDPRVLDAVRAASDKIAKLTPRQRKKMMRILLSFNDLPKPSSIIKRIIEHVAPETNSPRIRGKHQSSKRHSRKFKSNNTGARSSGALAGTSAGSITSASGV